MVSLVGMLIAFVSFAPQLGAGAEVWPAVAVLAPGETPPGDKLVQDLVAHAERKPWSLGAEFDLFVTPAQHVVLISHRVPEFRRLLATVQALEGLAQLPGDDPGALPDGMRSLVADFIETNLPGFEGLSRSKAPLNCIIRPMAFMSVSSGGRTLKLDVELPTFEGVAKDERNKRMRKLFDEPAVSSITDEASAQKALASAERRNKESAGTKGINLRLVNRQRISGVMPKLYEEASTAFSERMGALQQQANEKIAKFLPDLLKRYAAYFGNREGSVSLRDAPSEQRLQVESRLTQNYREYGFASPEAAHRFLSDASIDGTELGLSVGIGIMPTHMILRIPIWPH